MDIPHHSHSRSTVPRHNMRDSSDDDIALAETTGKHADITHARAESLSLYHEIAEVQKGIDLFFNNKFLEAKELTASKSTSHMYHALGYSTLLFVEAVMTFESEAINKAIASIKSSINVCNMFRKRKSIANSVSHLLGLSANIDPVDVERHAELIFAELNMYRANLTFIQDENLISFIRGALKIRMCYQSYNYCQKLADKLKPTPTNMHFIGGVLVGCGFFNIALSLLPPRILSMLEWIGFSSNKAKGLEQLQQAYSTPNLRSSLISVYLLSYHFFLTVHLGTHDADLNLASRILSQMFKKYPNGIFFHLFAGRLEQLKGNFDTAIEYLTKATSLQSQWKQFSHLCYWELMWCHAYKMEWKKAADFAELLRQESNWSKCVYTYLRATFLFQLSLIDHRSDIVSLMRSVPDLMQRFAGKSIPSEKFVSRKSRKFLEQGLYLFLPVQEMLYCWSGLVMLKENSDLRAKHLELLNTEFENMEKRNANVDKGRRSTTDPYRYEYYDDFCLLQLLKGALLRFNHEDIKAELCLVDIRNKYHKLKRDHYLAPSALADLSWMMIEQERYEEANSLLKYIRKTYSHYSMESRIHFRIHAAQTKLDEVMAEMAGTS